MKYNYTRPVAPVQAAVVALQQLQHSSPQVSRFVFGTDEGDESQDMLPAMRITVGTLLRLPFLFSPAKCPCETAG